MIRMKTYDRLIDLEDVFESVIIPKPQLIEYICDKCDSIITDIRLEDRRVVFKCGNCGEIHGYKVEKEQYD